MHGWIGSPVLDHNFSIFVHFFHDFYPIQDSHQKLKGSKWHEKRGKILKIKIYGRYLPESQSNVKEQYLKIQSGMRINYEIILLCYFSALNANYKKNKKTGAIFIVIFRYIIHKYIFTYLCSKQGL